MKAGYVVELAFVGPLYADPRHPYTLGLLGSLPRVDGRHARRLTNIDGRPPDLLEEPRYCPFAPRCEYVMETCWEKNPCLRPVADAHEIACWVDVKEATPMHVAGGHD
jgi:oligopeptide transport system ATP-binding protein